MPRDYKNAVRGLKSESRVSSGLLGVVAGFAAGFGTAVLLQVGVPDKGAGQQAAQAVADKPAEKAPDKTPDNRPTFDFYEMLPNFEVVIPEPQPDSGDAGKIAEVEQPGVYVLQVGSFRNAADADRLRAELALTGIESEVQTVTIDRNQTWHRVRIGPFTNLDRLNAMRERLAANDVEVLMIRLDQQNQ